MDFKAQFIVARKIERAFRNRFQAKEDLFYDFLVGRLFTNVLHRYSSNFIYFAKRGSRDRQVPLETAIQAAKKRFQEKRDIPIETSFSIQAQTPKGEPCLSIIDCMNWAVYRAYTKQEMRYYRFVEDKVSLLAD